MQTKLRERLQNSIDRLIDSLCFATDYFWHNSKCLVDNKFLSVQTFISYYNHNCTDFQPSEKFAKVFGLLLVMGPGQRFLTRVRSIFCGSCWVRHPWFGFGKFPLKKSNFSIFFPLDQKKSLRLGSEFTRIKGRSATYLLRVKSKLRSDWARANL